MKEVEVKKVLEFMFSESFKGKHFWRAQFLMPLSALAIGGALPFIISHLLASLANGQVVDNWQSSMVLFAVAAIIGVLANRLGFIALVHAQTESLENIQSKMVTTLLQKSGDFYANRFAGKIVSDGIALSSAFQTFQNLLVISATPFLVSLIAGIIIVSVNSWALGLGLFLITVIVMSEAIYSSRGRAHLRRDRREVQREMHGLFADIIANNQNVKVFASESEEIEAYGKVSSKLSKKRVSDWTALGKNGSNRIATILTLQGLFILLIIFVVNKNSALLATGIFAFSFTLSLSNKLFDITNMIMNFETVVTDSGPMIEIINQAAEIIDSPDATELIISESRVVFNNVTFNYADNNNRKPLFNGLSFDIKPGEKIGLVGHSGGGKTTITKLILRLADISKGQILIDQQNIAKVTQKSLRHALSYVSQEPLLFHRSIAENIAYGKPNASIAEIKNAAKLAFAHDFVKELPHGYDTLVGERGVKLSGGQRQRIAIARALLKDAPILVLDEATSALDSESEVLIQKALWKLMDGRTAIVIAHRLSTIQKMDRIIVLDDGEIVEQGSHKELLSKDGIYSKLWAHQSGGFIDD